MSFKIVITNNDDGKEIVNNDNVKVIIGGFTDDENTAEMCFCKGSSMDLSNAIRGARKVISKIEKENPEIEMLIKFRELFEKAEDKE